MINLKKMELKIMENKTERIGFSKDQMIQFLKIMQHNTNTMLEMNAQNFENNKQYMKMEEQLFYEKWKSRYMARRLKWVATHYDLPNIVVTEEELDDQIKRQEN
tara:strand:+ start:3425 stop:3736 length:312 start_codon:yes stop_codon:yes gene_type:complete